MMRFVLALGFGVACVACGGGKASATNPTAPTPTTASGAITAFVSGLQTIGGTAAARTTGTPPAANGGPTITVAAANSSAAQGGSTLVRLTGAAPFNVVYLSVAEAAAGEYYALTLPGSTADISLVMQFAQTIPASTFRTLFNVKAPDGQVGSASSFSNTVSAAATSARLELTYSPDPAPCMVVLNPGFWSYRWPQTTYLRETNGIGVTITSWRTNSFENTFPFASAFNGCGTSGARIPPNGSVCHGGFALAEFPTGRTFTETFTGTDDRGNTVTVTGGSRHLDCP
ncbi:MAG: hypothetical protein WC815_20075 [Vicinamibacterales bacterium]